MTSPNHNNPDDRKDNHEITRLLLKWGAGDQEAFEELSGMVYNDLRRIARRQMRGERDGHTLNTTALVHEAVMQLIRYDKKSWHNREHFYNLTAKLMRHILVNYALARNSQRRGRGVRPLEFDEAEDCGRDESGEIHVMIAVHQALEGLAMENERRARVVELKYFLGLSDKETAVALKVSEKTVEREWKEAREWLWTELSGGKGGNNGI